MSHCSAGWTRSSRRAFLWSPAGYYFFSNHFTILREGTVCAQSPPINLLTLTPTHSFAQPMLPYPPLTHWAALSCCDRCLVDKIVDILALALNDKRIQHMAMETKLFDSLASCQQPHIVSTALSVRNRIFSLRDRGREPGRERLDTRGSPPA